MSEVIALSDASAELSSTLEELTKASDGLVVALDLTAEAVQQSWAGVVSAPAETLMLRAGADARAEKRESLVAVVKTATPDADSGWSTGLQQAALEAVRGIVGCIALERAGDGLVANLVVTNATTTRHDLELTVNYLLDPRYNGFTTGATLKLTRPGYPEQIRADGGRSAGRVLITGAAGTIGFATARAFESAGYQVVLSDLDPDRLAQRQTEMPDAETVTLDVTDRDAVRELVRSEKLAPALAAAVFVHGFQGSQSLAELNQSMIESSMSVNGTSIAAAAEELLPLLAAGGDGALVVVSSQCGIRAESMTTAYCAPKFGIIGLQRGLAGYLAERGVSFNTLCPGPVDTAFLRAYFDRFAVAAPGQSVDEVVAERAESMAVGRFARPVEMGEALRFLAQLDATGVLLAPTGGETLT